MTLKRAKNYFHLGQQELEDFKGGEAQFIVELIIEAQARLMNLLAAGFEISTKKQPKQLEFLRWWNNGKKSEKINKENFFYGRPGIFKNSKRKNSKRSD